MPNERAVGHRPPRARRQRPGIELLAVFGIPGPHGAVGRDRGDISTAVDRGAQHAGTVPGAHGKRAVNAVAQVIPFPTAEVRITGSNQTFGFTHESVCQGQLGEQNLRAVIGDLGHGRGEGRAVLLALAFGDLDGQATEQIVGVVALGFGRLPCTLGLGLLGLGQRGLIARDVRLLVSACLFFL